MERLHFAPRRRRGRAQTRAGACAPSRSLRGVVQGVRTCREPCYGSTLRAAQVLKLSTCLSAAIAPLFPRRAHSTTRTGALPERPALQAGRAAGRTSRALCTSLASGMKRKMTLAPLAPGTPAPSGVMAKSYTCAGGHGLVTHCPSVSIVKQHLQHVCARHARGAAGGRSPCRR